MQAATMHAAQPDIAVSVTPQAAPQQTWWEHWSSGIVLIVLLIALATASILAWQGSSKGNSKLMADTKNEADSQSDLSNISVPKLDNPKIAMPKVETPVSTKANSYVENLDSPSAQNNARAPKSDDLDSSLIPNGSLSLTLDPPTNNTKSEPQTEPEAYATASLNPPVVKPQEPLFKDSELTQSKSGLSAQPASTSTQRSATNSDKPALWDSSKANGHDASKPLTLEFSSDDSSLLGNSSTPTSDSTAESPTASAKLISQSSADAANTNALTTPATLVPKALQTVVKTVTPEMDQAELFAAYRELKAPTAPAKVDNRYGSTAAAGNQTQTGMSNGTQASVVGYTQQPTQTNSQPAQTSNNYTLQPAQNFAGNAGLMYPGTPNANTQNPAQYSTQQYQNPQYPTQQYSGQPLPGQQYPGQQYTGQRIRVNSTTGSNIQLNRIQLSRSTRLNHNQVRRIRIASNCKVCLISLPRAHKAYRTEGLKCLTTRSHRRANPYSFPEVQLVATVRQTPRQLADPLAQPRT